jgi:hypothetical protein
MDEKTATMADIAVMEMLKAHVPLSLLFDLAFPDGPDSQEILAAEAQERAC